MVVISALEEKNTRIASGDVIILNDSGDGDETKKIDRDNVKEIDDAATDTESTWSSDKINTELWTKATSAHSHVIDDVTGLQTAIDGKAATTHSHAIDDVTGLQTALDAKSATWHTHTDIVKGNVVTGTFTLDDAAQADITIAHGLWVAPKAISSVYPNEWIYTSIWIASYDGSTITQKVWNKDDDNREDDFVYFKDGVDRWWWTITAIDATNVTLSYNFSGSYSVSTINYALLFTG